MRTKYDQIASFKELWKKEHGEDLTDAQALEYYSNLLGFFELLLRIDTRIRKWNERLVQEPEGFPVPARDSYNCAICHQYLSNGDGWYDQYGIKCPVCQKAIKENVIPGTVASDRGSWFSTEDLKDKFGWHHTTVGKKVRIGELKARRIKNGDRHWLFVFLKEENPNLIQSER